MREKNPKVTLEIKNMVTKLKTESMSDLVKLRRESGKSKMNKDFVNLNAKRKKRIKIS